MVSRNVVDLIEAARGHRGTLLAGSSTGRTVQDHAGGARATFQAACSWTPPRWLGITVHACRVCVGVGTCIVGIEVRQTRGSLAGGVVGAAAARDTIAAVDAVPLAVTRSLHSIPFRHELRGAAGVIYAVDFLVRGSRGLGHVRRLGSLVVCTGQWARGAVEVAVRGVGRADWHRGRARRRSRQSVIGVAPRASVGAGGACSRACGDGGARGVVRGVVVGASNALGTGSW